MDTNRLKIEGVLAAWGAHHRNDPFPIFASVRPPGPVHRVTLAEDMPRGWS